MSLRDIGAAHHRSFVESGRTLRGAVLVLYGPAVAVVSALALTKWLLPAAVTLDRAVGQSLIAALTLLAGLLFALGVTVLGKAIDMDLAGPEPGPGTTTAALRLQALSANAFFTAILSGGATGVLIAGSLFPSFQSPLSVLAIGMVIAVGTSGVFVAGRVFAETTGRTERARTGVSRDDRRQQPEQGGPNSGL